MATFMPFPGSSNQKPARLVPFEVKPKPKAIEPPAPAEPKPAVDMTGPKSPIWDAKPPAGVNSNPLPPLPMTGPKIPNLSGLARVVTGSRDSGDQGLDDKGNTLGDRLGRNAQAWKTVATASAPELGQLAGEGLGVVKDTIKGVGKAFYDRPVQELGLTLASGGGRLANLAGTSLNKAVEKPDVPASQKPAPVAAAALPGANVPAAPVAAGDDELGNSQPSKAIPGTPEAGPAAPATTAATPANTKLSEAQKILAARKAYNEGQAALGEGSVRIEGSPEQRKAHAMANATRESKRMAIAESQAMLQRVYQAAGKVDPSIPEASALIGRIRQLQALETPEAKPVTEIGSGQFITVRNPDGSTEIKPRGQIEEQTLEEIMASNERVAAGKKNAAARKAAFDAMTDAREMQLAEDQMNANAVGMGVDEYRRKYGETNRRFAMDQQRVDLLNQPHMLQLAIQQKNEQDKIDAELQKADATLEGKRIEALGQLQSKDLETQRAGAGKAMEVLQEYYKTANETANTIHKQLVEAHGPEAVANAVRDPSSEDFQNMGDAILRYMAAVQYAGAVQRDASALYAKFLSPQGAAPAASAGAPAAGATGGKPSTFGSLMTE